MGGRYSIDFSQWFYYDETSPTFLRWKIDIYQGGRIGKYKGDVAGCLEWRKNGKDNYCSVGLKNKRYKAHNIILSLHGFELEKGFVADHIDGNTHNGNIKNLRVVPYRHNCMNCRLEPTSTGKIGVCIVNNGGYKSVRASWLTPEEKAVFKTGFEIPQEVILRLASRRQRYIDQGQSLNLFIDRRHDEEYISYIHQIAFKDPYIKGLYYLIGKREGDTDEVIVDEPMACDSCQ